MLYGLYANRPGYGTQGRLFQPSDSPLYYIDDSTRWIGRMPGSFMEHDPGLSTFQTWVNQDSCAIDITTGVVKLTPLAGQANTTHRFHLRVDPVVGAQFTMTLAMQLGTVPGGTTNGGIILRDSTTGRFMVYGVVPQNLYMSQYSGPTTISAANVFADLWRPAMDRDVYLRLVADATNFKFYYSFDAGNTWLLHRTRTISGDYLAGYNQVGYGISNYSQVASTQAVAMKVLHAKQS